MIWILAVFLVSTAFGSVSTLCGVGVVSLAALWGIWLRRWQPPRTGLEWLVLGWIAFSILGFALQFELGLESWLRLTDFFWVPVLYFLFFLIQRSRMSESVTLWVGAWALLVGLWVISVYLVPIDLKDLEFGLDLGRWEFNADVLGQVAGFMLSFMFGLLLVGFNFPRKQTWGIFATVLLLILALYFSAHWFVLAAFLGAAVLSTFFYSVRFALFVILPLALVGLAFIHRPLLETLPHIELSSLTALMHGNPVFGDGVGFHSNAEFPLGLLRLLSESGIGGLLIFIVTWFYFLFLAVRAWAVSSDRNSFHKGLALGLISAQLYFAATNFVSTGFMNLPLRMLIVLAWAMILWLAFETRVLRERI